MESWWERLWLTQLWRIHLHHVARHQKARQMIRELRQALDWAHAYADEQRRQRQDAEAREAMAAHVAAAMGTDALQAWLADRDDDEQ